jgi:hypothetical protein
MLTNMISLGIFANLSRMRFTFQAREEVPFSV